MKIGIKTLLLLCVLIQVASCASDEGVRQRGPGQPALSCPYKQDAIKISLIADPQLNLFDNAAHTLYMCFYQLKNPNIFKLKTKYEEGLNELLECSLFDPSVTSFERVTLQPGKNQELTLDRAEASNYFAVVAGYYGQEELEKDRMIRFMEIPVETKRKLLTPWKKVHECRDLSLEITLGPQQIERIEILEK